MGFKELDWIVVIGGSGSGSGGVCVCVWGGGGGWSLILGGVNAKEGVSIF